jgi:hypothetical protein
MTQSWFYHHAGKTHGPVSTAEVRDLAARGLLAPNDLLWPEGTSAAEAITADAALDFSRLPRRADAGALPDWLGDVKKMERKGPLPPPQA